MKTRAALLHWLPTPRTTSNNAAASPKPPPPPRDCPVGADKGVVGFVDFAQGGFVQGDGLRRQAAVRTIAGVMIRWAGNSRRATRTALCAVPSRRRPRSIG